MTKSKSYHLGHDDKQIRAVLRFASMRNLRNDRVYNLLGIEEAWRLPKRHSADPFLADQAELCGWLDSLIRHGSLKPAQVRTIQWRLRETVLRAPAVPSFDGERIGWSVPFHAPGVQAICALAVASLADRALADRLRKCEECGSFFLDQGKFRPRRYCSSKCGYASDKRKAVERQQKARRNRL